MIGIEPSVFFNNNSKIERYQFAHEQSDVRVHIGNDSAWLSRQQLLKVINNTDFAALTLLVAKADRN